MLRIDGIHTSGSRLRRRREWVSKRKDAGGIFSRRDTPQSKEKGSEAVLRAHFDYATGEGNEKSHLRNQIVHPK